MSNQAEQPKQLSKRAQTARYVVYVDHQAKGSFGNLADAEEQAQKILMSFPKLAVKVVDEDNNSVNTLGPTTPRQDIAENKN